MNRRTFLTGTVAGAFAASFALRSDAPTPPRAPLGGVDILPASGRAPTSMVVLLHGFGGNGESMRQVAQAWAKVLPDTVFVLPDAPFQCHENPNDPRSREWFAVRALDRDAALRVAQIRRVEPILNEHIDAKLAHYGLNDRCLVIAGMSQGAMMALHAAPRRSMACAAVVAYSGMLVDSLGLQRDRVTRPPVLALHGNADTVVPYRHLADVENGFKNAGFQVEAVTYNNLGHSMNLAGIRKGADFIRTQLAQSCAPRMRRTFGR